MPIEGEFHFLAKVVLWSVIYSLPPKPWCVDNHFYQLRGAGQQTVRIGVLGTKLRNYRRSGFKQPKQIVDKAEVLKKQLSSQNIAI